MALKGSLIDHQHRISLAESRNAQELKAQLQLVAFDPALFLEPILNNTQLSDQPGAFYLSLLVMGEADLLIVFLT